MVIFIVMGIIIYAIHDSSIFVHAQVVTYPLIQMSDTTASTGVPVYAANPALVEYVSGTSQLVGKSIDQITMKFRSVGLPSGTVEVGIINQNLSFKRSFGTMSASSISTNATNYTFSLTGGQLYTIQPGDRIGVKFSGGNSHSYIGVTVDVNQGDPFDGVNSYRQAYTTSWSSSTTGDMYMILTQTHSLNTNPPTISASPAGGIYNSTQLVALSSNQNVTTMYYTIDGSTPSTSSTVYASPISISNTTTLKFFGINQAGNSSLVNTQQYVIDAITSQKFSIDLYRADVNQTSLTGFFNIFTTNRDFVYPVGTPNPTNYQQVKAGNFTLGIALVAQTDSTIAKAKSMHVNYLIYDLEPGAGADFTNYVNSTIKVANKVHAAGLKLILEPRWLEIQSYGTQIAPYADMITMQIPYPLSSLNGGYVNWVSQYSALLRNSAGHPILIGEQLLTKPSRTSVVVNNYNPSDIAAGYNSTKQYVNYIQLFYFNQTFADNTNKTITSDVIPYLSKFYKGIGMPGFS